MISSQCNRPFPAGGRTLTEIRKDIRDRIEKIKILGQPIFEVWINEDSPGRGTDVNSWDACLDEVRRADILIVLNAGHGGWAPNDGALGICHTELSTAHDSAPGKIRIIPLQGTQPLPDELSQTNDRFRDYVGKLNPFAPAVRTEAQLSSAVDAAVVSALTSLVELGVRSAKKGAYHSGDALTWSTLSFADRAAEMRKAVLGSLLGGGGRAAGAAGAEIEIAGTDVGFEVHASPAALSVSASRELVGRPFLRDHEYISDFTSGAIGPVHVIACQSGVTEAQARAMLGFPDAAVIRPPFGVFVADNVQQIQFALLRDCRDQTTTRNAVRAFLAWLDETDEGARLVHRAKRRHAIAQAIHAAAS